MSEIETDSLIDMNDEGGFVDPELALQQILENPNLVQHVTRTQIEECETIAGYFRIAFEPGQQHQVLHVPISPPFKSVPGIEANATDAQDVRVRITDGQKFGIRLEIILSHQTDSQRQILVEVIANAAIQ